MSPWNFYTSKELKPQGWLRRQLEIQADSLSGNLHKVWRDVRDSAWIGGDAEGWERVPYWLDGFIPLAYLLEREDLIADAKKYIDSILAAQQEDGWICPCTEEERSSYDTWAVQLISKVLTVYYECSGDERILDVLYHTLKIIISCCPAEQSNSLSGVSTAGMRAVSLSIFFMSAATKTGSWIWLVFLKNRAPITAS
ncbi:MAG: hypothetical protein IJ411_04050 [Oscillospiraceae bacterium]|nr:hypothetical protein [Oscillospiraceae bacterium]